MMDFLRTYRAKPWPRLEVPTMRRRHLTNLALFMLALITAGWFIFLTPITRVGYFALLGLAIPVFFLLKSRFVALVGLLTFEVIIAFMFMGNTGYVFAAVAALAGAIIAFESPIALYMLLIIAAWFDQSLFAIGYQKRTELIIGAGLLVGWIFKLISQDRAVRKPLHFYEKLPALLLFSWVVAGFLLWSPSRVPEGWMQLKPFILGILFFIITPLLIRDEKRLNLTVWTWILAGLIATVGTVYAIISGFQPMTSAQDATGAALLVARKNDTASFISYSFFLALAAFYWEEGAVKKWLIGAILAIYLSVVLFLQSRMALMGIIFGFGVFSFVETFLNPEKRSALRIMGRLLVPASLLALALVGLYYFDLSHLLGYYGELLTPQSSVYGLEFRMQTWEMIREMIENEGHLLRGLGIGAFWVLASLYGFPFADFAENFGIYHAHSLYLDILVHYGVIGLVIFLWLILTNLGRLWRGYLKLQSARSKYLYLGLLCGLVSFYFHGLGDDVIAGATEWWLYLGLAVATINVRMMENESDNVY